MGLIGTDSEKLRSLAAELGLADGHWHPAAGDVTNADDVHRAVGEISEALGPADVVVHVVGGWLGGTPAVELDMADVATSFDQHVFSTLHMVQATVPGMVERGWGRVFAISQPLATEPGPRGGGYLMAKAAQEVMLRSLARDLAGSGVTANLLIVKTIDKDHERDREPTAKNAQWTTPEEIAAADGDALRGRGRHHQRSADSTLRPLIGPAKVASTVRAQSRRMGGCPSCGWNRRRGGGFVRVASSPTRPMRTAAQAAAWSAAPILPRPRSPARLLRRRGGRGRAAFARPSGHTVGGACGSGAARSLAAVRHALLVDRSAGHRRCHRRGELPDGLAGRHGPQGGRLFRPA
jgi:NAD(P)-dependent dehydrogenase (short-subunit alcohol dehydrogenase family)